MESNPGPFNSMEKITSGSFLKTTHTLDIQQKYNDFNSLYVLYWSQVKKDTFDLDNLT